MSVVLWGTGTEGFFMSLSRQFVWTIGKLQLDLKQLWNVGAKGLLQNDLVLVLSSVNLTTDPY